MAIFFMIVSRLFLHHIILAHTSRVSWEVEEGPEAPLWHSRRAASHVGQMDTVSVRLGFCPILEISHRG
eukprot:scaffold2120_cov259-Pinguiococcus_pyrenoidosus.AAC.4